MVAKKKDEPKVTDLTPEIRVDNAKALMTGLKDYPTGHFEALLTIGVSLAID
jgi:hypothetical protein